MPDSKTHAVRIIEKVADMVDWDASSFDNNDVVVFDHVSGKYVALKIGSSARIENQQLKIGGELVELPTSGDVVTDLTLSNRFQITPTDDVNLAPLNDANWDNWTVLINGSEHVVTLWDNIEWSTGSAPLQPVSVSKSLLINFFRVSSTRYLGAYYFFPGSPGSVPDNVAYVDVDNKFSKVQTFTDDVNIGSTDYGSINFFNKNDSKSYALGMTKSSLDLDFNFSAINITSDVFTGKGTGLTDLDWGALVNLPTSFTPSSHSTTHKSGGTDSIKLDELAAPDDNTTLNATTKVHGLLPKLSGNKAEFLDGTGSWVEVEVTGGGDFFEGEYEDTDLVGIIAKASFVLDDNPLYLRQYDDYNHSIYWGFSKYSVDGPVVHGFDGVGLASGDVEASANELTLWTDLTGTKSIDDDGDLQYVLLENSLLDYNNIPAKVVSLSDTAITLSDEHRGCLIECTSSSAVTVEVPSDLEEGFYCSVIQAGDGSVTITAGNDVDLNPGDNLELEGKWSVVNIYMRAPGEYTVLNSSSGGGGDTNSFGTIAVSGKDSIIAGAPNSTLTLVAGSGVTISTDKGASSVTFAAVIPDGVALLGEANTFSKENTFQDDVTIVDSDLVLENDSKSKSVSLTCDEDGNALISSGVVASSFAGDGSDLVNIQYKNIPAQVVTNSSTSITLTNEDHRGVILECTADEPIVVTVPAGLPEGFYCTIVRAGAGELEVQEGAEATLEPSDNIDITEQWGSVYLYRSDTDTYVALVSTGGDLPENIAYTDAPNTFTAEGNVFSKSVRFPVGINITSAAGNPQYSITNFGVRVSPLGGGLEIASIVWNNTDGRWEFTVPGDFLPATFNLSKSGFDLGKAGITANGSALTNLDATNISTGTLSADRLATSGVTADSYGSATESAVITVDKYGRITAAENKTISTAAGGSDTQIQFNSSNALAGLSSFTTDGTGVSLTTSDSSTTPRFVVTNSSTGDAAIRFAIGSSQSYALGIDNDDSDAFVISHAASASAVLGTNNAVRISSTGLFSVPNGIFTGSSTSTSNFHASGGTGISSDSLSDSEYQLLSGSSIYRNIMGGSTSSKVQQNVSYATLLLRSSPATEASSGTHALMSQVAVKPLVLTDGTATTTNGATVYIEGPAGGTATITNNYSLWVDNGSVRFDGDILIGTTDYNLASVSEVGYSLFTITDPSETAYIRLNDDKTISQRTPPEVINDLVTIITDDDTSITLSDATHSGRILECTSDDPVTIEIPTGLSANFNVMVIQSGEGPVTFTEGSGATIYPDNDLKTSSQWAAVSIYRHDEDEYVVSGGLYSDYNIESEQISDATTAGKSLITVTNPGVLSYPSIGADNKAVTRTPPQVRGDLGFVTPTTLSTSGSVSIDTTANTAFVLSLTDDVTLSVTGDADGSRFTLFIRGQDDDYEITWWGGIKWNHGDTPPTLPDTDGQVLRVTFVRLASGEWLGEYGDVCG